jgi:hypothetical protein
VATWHAATDAAYAQAEERRNAAANYLNNTPNLAAVQVQALQNIIRTNEGAMSAAVQERDRLAAQIRAGQGSGGGGYTGPTAAEIAAEQERIRQEAEKRRRDQEAKAYLEDLFSQYGGMQDLVGRIDQLIRDYGNSPEVLVGKVRQTEPYKRRFKGLVQLQQQGITDIRNEDEYLRLESEYRSVFREAGMNDFLGVDGSQDQFDNIADLVSDYKVSVNEVRARVNDAARVVADTTPEVADALEEYYGIDAATLTEYVLDPVRTQNKINEIANTTMLGAAARRSGLDVERSAMEQVAGLAGNEDVNVAQYSREFARATVSRDATSRLASIEDSNLTDSEVLLSELDLDQNAMQKIRGLRSRERARFGGSSGLSSQSLETNRG